MRYIREIMPFRDIPVLGGLLSVGDLVFAALLSLIITWLMLRLSAIFRRNGSSRTPAADLNSIMERCFTLFPNETIVFKDKTFTRGMMVKVRTIRNKTFEGRLIGCNKDNIVCVMTQTYIAADMLENIVEMDMMDETA